MGWFLLVICICIYIIDHDLQVTKIKKLEEKVRDLELEAKDLELAAKEAVAAHAPK